MLTVDIQQKLRECQDLTKNQQRQKKKDKILEFGKDVDFLRIKNVEIFFKLKSLPGYPCVSLKKFRQFGPAVLPAIANILMREELYYIDTPMIDQPPSPFYIF